MLDTEMGDFGEGSSVVSGSVMGEVKTGDAREQQSYAKVCHDPMFDVIVWLFAMMFLFF